MNKTQSVLQENKFVTANVRVGLIGLLWPHNVQRVQRGEETFFRFTPCRLDDHKKQELTLSKSSLRGLTDAFLRIETVDEAQQFFEQFSPWKNDPQGKRLRFSGKQSMLRWSELRGFQSALRQSWMAESPDDWHDQLIDLALHMPIYFDLGSRHCGLISAATSVSNALAADLIFTTLSNLPSGFCARADCGRLFQRETKHEKKFCSPECAHLESVRKYRARASKKNRKGRSK